MFVCAAVYECVAVCARVCVCTQVDKLHARVLLLHQQPAIAHKGACNHSLLTLCAVPTTACVSQEMTLEEYERQLAEKKASLNKQREAKAVNSTEEFKGMKVSTRCHHRQRSGACAMQIPVLLSLSCKQLMQSGQDTLTPHHTTPHNRLTSAR